MNNITFKLFSLIFAMSLLFFLINNVYSQEEITNSSIMNKKENSDSNITNTGNSTFDYALNHSNITNTGNSLLEQARLIAKTSGDLTTVCSSSITNNCMYWDPQRGNFDIKYGDHHQGADISSSVNPAWIDNPNW